MSESQDRDEVFLKLFLKTSPEEVTEEELSYFAEHPDEIDEVTAPVNVHKLFLWGGALLGAMLVGISTMLGHIQAPAFMSAFFSDYVMEILSGLGSELIGAAVTAYLLGILMNKQQDNAARWRAEIRRRLKARKTAGKATSV